MSDPVILQFSEAALVVLKEAREPLHYREITERVLEKGLVASKGKTPHDTMRVQLSRLVTSALAADEAPQVESLGKGVWRLVASAGDSLPSEMAKQEDDETEPKTAEQETRSWANNRNVIFFGPPGTGKSFFLASVVRKHLAAPEDHVFRVTFHPEYSYYDFVGSYRPAVGWLKTSTSFIGADDKERSEEPRTYYHFDPGPLSQAIQLAANSPDKPTVLIIEEINRGNCAAIFGDVFQLLDRIIDKTRAKQRGLLVGTSEYAIQPSAEWAGWLQRELCAENSAFSCDRRDRAVLRLPPNLYLYASMNTSDQSLFPMDTAFRRRWGMEFVGIGRSTDERVRVPLHANDEKGVPWLRLMRQLNTQIVRHTRTDDKQMGPYFVRPTSVGEMVGADDFCAKVIFYLWSDVFRDQPSAVFSAKLTTYEEVVAAFNDGKHVFHPDLLQGVGIKKAQTVGEGAAPPPND